MAFILDPKNESDSSQEPIQEQNIEPPVYYDLGKSLNTDNLDER
jgi:hypothetical protein